MPPSPAYHSPTGTLSGVVDCCSRRFGGGRNLSARRLWLPCLAHRFRPDDVLALTNDETVKATLKDNTETAVNRGVFGAPTLFIGNQMFFGQDRLDFVEEALRQI